MGADVIDGGAGDDSLFGQGGNDTILGGFGDDLIHGGSGVDFIRGGSGSDTIYGGDGSEENVRGDGGNDILRSGGEGHYYGDKGNDIINAGSTSGVKEVLDGGAGWDTVDTTDYAGPYQINLQTGATNLGQEVFLHFENVTSGAGSDIITGTKARNVISGNGSTDTIFGRGGDDVISGGAGADKLGGDGGRDTLDYSTGGVGVTVSLSAHTASGGDAAGDIFSGFENIFGSSGFDVLTGDGKANQLRGNIGSDTLNGKGGNDLIIGGFGPDTMTGGSGKDVFLFDASIANNGTITDFNSAQDTIKLDNDIFIALSSKGTLRDGAFHKSASGLAHDGNDRVIYDTDSGALFYDTDGFGALAPVQFAILSNKPSISHSDFVIV